MKERKASFWVVVCVASVATLSFFLASMRVVLLEKQRLCVEARASLMSDCRRGCDLLSHLLELTAKDEGTPATMAPRDEMLLCLDRVEKVLKTSDLDEVTESWMQLLKAYKAFEADVLESSVVWRANLDVMGVRAEVAVTTDVVRWRRHYLNQRIIDFNSSIRKYSWVPLCGGFRSR